MVLFSMTEINEKMLFLSQISIMKNKDRKFIFIEIFSPVKLFLIFTTFDFEGSEQALTEMYYTDLQET